MLLRFEVSNHRSIKDPVELSMIAVDADRPATRGFDGLNERVLTVAGIYGPNASGKTNLLDALRWLARAVALSLRSWDKQIPREPFGFADGPSTPATFEVEMVVEEVRYVYRAELDQVAVLFEGLYSYPERRRRVLFEREAERVHFRRGLGNAAGTRELLTPTTLALSAAMRFDEPEIRTFGRAIGAIRAIRTPGMPALASPASSVSTINLFGELEGWGQRTLFDDTDDVSVVRESALALLRFADLGIDDVNVIDDKLVDEVAGEPGSVSRPSRPRLQFVHRVGGQELTLDAFRESSGTRTWFVLIGPVLSALRSGRVVVLDEIDASLHPRLSARLIELFQDPETNPRGAQLIFTAHDTSLLNHLNRDEVWLTEKGPDGATSLTALAEYGGDKVRRSMNLEKAYLQGRFGAVPELDQALLRRAVGLVTGDPDGP